MAKPKIRPLGDRVICQVIEGGEEKIGSIVIPDTAREKPQEAKVVAVGSGKYIEGKLVDLDVKVGDKILFGKYSGTEIKSGTEEYLILRESDILAIVQ